MFCAFAYLHWIISFLIKKQIFFLVVLQFGSKYWNFYEMIKLHKKFPIRKSNIYPIKILQFKVASQNALNQALNHKCITEIKNVELITQILQFYMVPKMIHENDIESHGFSP